MKRSLLISTLLMFVSALIAQPTLIKGNLNDNLNLNESSNPTNFVNMGNKTYFTANGPSSDVGLYVSDGTEGGTRLVKQLNSRISNLINSGNSLFFIYENSSIFISDGTKEGTKPFAKFRSVSKMINISGTVYFTADDQIHGLELWKTDGTTSGTKLVKDVAYGLPSSQIVSWKTLGDKLVFFANDGINGVEPWITDGTEAGTKIIKNINQSGGIMEYASEMSLFRVNDYIIFTANDGINGTELWSTNGTPEGTHLLKDINAGTGNTFQYFSNLILYENLNNQSYFLASDNNSITALYKTDGTPENTIKIIDIPGGAPYGKGFKLGNKLILGIQSENSNDNQLWISGGSSENTSRINLNTLKFNSNSEKWGVVLNNKFYFGGLNNSNLALVVTDGTENGTKILKESTGWGYPNEFSILNNSIYYWWAPNYQSGLWKTDGIETNAVSQTETSNFPGIQFYNNDSTKIFTPIASNRGAEPHVITDNKLTLLKDINTSNGILTKFLYNDNYWYFSNSFQRSNQLWRTNGTSNGTTMIKTCESPVLNSFVANGHVIFSEKRRNLWSFDGNSTTSISTFSNLTNEEWGYNSFKILNQTYFWKKDTGVVCLWKTDGTTAGTVFVKSFFKNRYNWIGATGKPFIYNDKAYFSVCNGDWNNARIYSFDGNTEDTTLLINLSLNQGAFMYDPNFTEINGKIYFNDQSSLYVLDNGNVKMIKSLSSNMDKFVRLNNKLIFVGNNYINGNEIWISDGTSDGTILLKEINPGKLDGIPVYNWQYYPRPITYGDHTYFWGDDGVHGIELWKTDGTQNGTVMVKDINPGLASSNPGCFYIQNNYLFFKATDEFHGTEIWCTDGSDEGTYIACEVNQGSNSSITDPNVFEFSGEYSSEYLFFGKDNDIYFPSISPEGGAQLWKFSISDLKNNAPQISGDLKDTSLVAGTPLQYFVPVFSFDDPNDYLSYVATLADGSPLPEWLNFNSDTRTFSGTPPTTQSVQVKVTAYDRGNLSVSKGFNISVVNQTSGLEALQNKMVEVYPNPASEYIIIDIKNELNSAPLLITINDMLGKTILQIKTGERINKIDIKHIPTGIYSVKIGDSSIIKPILISVQK